MSCYYWICNNKDFIQKYIDDVIVGFTQTGSYFFYFHVPYNAICFPHNIFRKFCSQLLKGRFFVPGETENKAYA